MYKRGLTFLLFLSGFSCDNNNGGRYPIIDPMSDSGNNAGQLKTIKASNLHGSEVVPISKNIFETISLSVDHTLFIAALESSGFDKILSSSKIYTVIAPTDEAFKRLPRDLLNNLLKPSSSAQLHELIANHIIEGKILLDNLKEGAELKTLGGRKFNIVNKDGRITIANVSIQAIDEICSNGVLNIADGVLLK